MNKFKFIASIIILSIAQISAFAYSNDKINNLAHAFIQKNQVEGLSIAVIQNNKTRIYNYGYADKSKKIPITNNTIYPVASFSKTYTATLAAIAATEGKLDLNAPIYQYIPELKKNSTFNNITTTMLLEHVASLPFNFTPPPKTYDEAIKYLTQFTPTNSPGTYYLYSNVSIGTAGLIVEKAYNSSYATLLEDKISKPLDLHSTYLNVPNNKIKLIALGHDSNNKIVPYDPNIPVWFAAASLKSTIQDMAKFLDAQINYTQLKNQTLVQAIRTVHQNNYCFTNKNSCEQLSWMAHAYQDLNSSEGDSFSTLDQNNSIKFAKQAVNKNTNFAQKDIFVDKTCSGFGISGYIAYIPDKKTGVVILINKTIGDERVRLGRDILLNLQ